MCVYRTEFFRCLDDLVIKYSERSNQNQEPEPEPNLLEKEKNSQTKNEFQNHLCLTKKEQPAEPEPEPSVVSQTAEPIFKDAAFSYRYLTCDRSP